MNRGLLASIVGIGLFGIAPWAHAQTPAPAASAPPSAAAFDAPSAAPAPAPSPAPAAEQPAPAAEPAAAAPAPAPVQTASPLATPSPAQAPPSLAVDEPEVNEPKPGSGLGLVITGWILSGVGVLNLALIPVCTLDSYPRDSRDLCVNLSIAVGVIGLGVGVPLLAVGYHKRSKFKDWKSRHAVLNELLSTQVALQHDSALLVYRGTF